MQDDAEITRSSKNEDTEARYLEKFIVKSKNRLKNILKRLRWDEETIQKNFNSNSVNAIETKLLSHREEDPFFPPSFSTRNSIVTSQEELCSIVSDLNAVVPQRFSDLQLNFNREQKLCIYEHVVQNTLHLLEPELAVPVHDDKNSSLTFAEIVDIKKREKKQKRRKYRTTKPTHIEEVRNLVELQMQALEQYLRPTESKKTHTSNESCEERGRQRYKRSISRESSTASHRRQRLLNNNNGTSNGQSKIYERSYSRRKRSVSRSRHHSRSESRERYRKKRKHSRSGIRGNSREKNNRNTSSRSSNEKRRNRHDDYKSDSRRSRSKSRSHSRDDTRRKYLNYKSRSKSRTSSVERVRRRRSRSKKKSSNMKRRNRNDDYKRDSRRSRNKSSSHSPDDSRTKYQNYKSRSKSRTSFVETRVANSRQKHEDYEDLVNHRRKSQTGTHERYESKRKYHSEQKVQRSDMKEGSRDEERHYEERIKVEDSNEGERIRNE